MASKRLSRRKITLLFLIVLMAAFISYAWRALPIITGYGTKTMASGVFLQLRSKEDIEQTDLGRFPLSLGRFDIDSSAGRVTGSVLGLAKCAAIYRPRLGCTLIKDYTEQEVRAQKFTRPPAPKADRDTILWPIGDLLPATSRHPVDLKALKSAMDFAMEARAVDGGPAHTRSVLVLYDGQIVGERYAKGFDRHSVMLGWSVSKTLTAALIGVLVNEGRLDIRSPAPVPEWKGTEKEKITSVQLLQQTSGLRYAEDYTSVSEVTNMLFKHGDMAAYAVSLPLENEPGTKFNYSGGNSNILARIVRQTVGEEEYSAFPFEHFFHRINMYSVSLEPDASGTYVGSSYSYMTTRDFARFGLLYYNDGNWLGEQVLPEDWVTQSITPPVANKLQSYGYQIWLNGFSEEDPTLRRYPDVPIDMYNAIGYGGQYIYIIPSRKLIVVRTGLYKFDDNEFLRLVLKSIPN